MAGQGLPDRCRQPLEGELAVARLAPLVLGDGAQDRPGAGADARWVVRTDKADEVSAQFLVLATGCLSSTNRPVIEGIDTFAGPIYHTGEWPHEEPDFKGKRVGVIGTGSSAIQ